MAQAAWRRCLRLALMLRGREADDHKVISRVMMRAMEPLLESECVAQSTAIITAGMRLHVSQPRPGLALDSADAGPINGGRPFQHCLPQFCCPVLSVYCTVVCTSCCYDYYCYYCTSPETELWL